MHKRIVFRHMDHSPVIEDFANQQLAKIEKFLESEPTPVYIDLVMMPSKTHEHSRIELLVKTPHYEKITEHEFQGDKFYDVLTDVIDTMYKELLEAKRRLKDDRKTQGRHDEFKKQR
jgi:ribosome-associated translation inhibitor RaiA